MEDNYFHTILTRFLNLYKIVKVKCNLRQREYYTWLFQIICLVLWESELGNQSTKQGVARGRKEKQIK